MSIHRQCVANYAATLLMALPGIEVIYL